MYWLFLLSAMVVAYLAGSLNFAIVVSTLLGKKDIRTLGNLNPGTANVGRNLGKGWGAVVFFGDVGKAVIPLIIAEDLYFHLGTPEGILGLMLMGMAAILGHRKPIFFGFRGGGGLATTLGVLGFFGPVELLISMLVGAGVGTLLFRNREFKFGRWVSMLIILLTPLVHLLFAFLVDIKIGGVIRFGGRSWDRIIAVGLLAAYVFLSNLSTVFETVRPPSRPVDHSGNP